jgi:S-adenosylmethionine:tRNA ribosyltransferase-isomerase
VETCVPRPRKLVFPPAGRSVKHLPPMPPLSTDLFDYDLPERLIAHTPAARRDESRLLVVDRATRALAHRRFRDLGEYLRPGDILVRNNVAVLPARLRAERPTGGAVECLLLRPAAEDPAAVWWCLLRPGKKLPVGAHFGVAGAFTAEVLAKDAEGAARVRFTTITGEPIAAVANRFGEVPLPPYITRTDPAAERATDLGRYQTVYADPARQLAAAAPTAGLHFTAELLANLAAQGVRTADVTLHVGLGTFKPIATTTIEEHPIHREAYEIPVETQRLLHQPNAGRRVAVGTTSVRTIEDHFRKHAAPLRGAAVDEAGLYLYPPCHYRGVDALITNFHQPRSTLLCLVSAFLTPGSADGIAWLKAIYAEAVARDYRFYSYGDAMLIL